MMKSLTSQLKSENDNNVKTFLEEYGFELPLVKEMIPRIL